MRTTLVAPVLTLLALLTACGEGTQTLDDSQPRTSGAGLTWEQFRDGVAFREPDTGVFIADGDTAFFNEKQLREFYELNVQQGQLIVNRVGSADDVWSAQQKLNLSYCISNSFSAARKALVVQALDDATAGWMAVANVRFVYDASKDANCTTSTSGVLFDVRPVNAGGQYLARAFFPSTPRSGREVLIDASAFDGTTSLTGVLRHELGHTLGFRHEHTRPEAGTCFEDNSWRALTAYDSSSVMHYPHCNGTNDWSLPLTALDTQGAATLYGAPGGGDVVPPLAAPSVETFSASVAQGRSKAYGPFAATPGSPLHVLLDGTGDADLYVRFGAAPTASKYACRPYLDGSEEDCALTVPPTASQVFVTVSGYSAATFTLRVEHTP